MSYITIKSEGIEEFEEKKSIFIGHIKRVSTEDEAKEYINLIKSKHKEARHNVYAYVIGQNLGIQRYSDDGEPQGTGGIPVLEVIKKNGLTDCVVVVTRYFGGILLGAGGLTRAYAKGASLAVKKGGIVEKVVGVEMKITIDYDLLGKLQYLCGQNNWFISDIDYTDKVIINILCEKEIFPLINEEINEATNGKAYIFKEKEDIYFKEGYKLFKTIE